MNKLEARNEALGLTIQLLNEGIAQGRILDWVDDDMAIEDAEKIQNALDEIIGSLWRKRSGVIRRWNERNVVQLSITLRFEEP